MKYKSEELIEKIGGKLYVAEKLGISKAAVYLWFYPKPSGSEGHVPAKQAIKLHELAKQKGIDCELNDFIG